MANITRIKAKDPRKPKKSEEPVDEKPWNEDELPPEDEANRALEESLEKEEKKAAKKEAKAAKKAAKKAKKPMSKPVRVITWPFRMIAKPFIAFGRYLADSWREIRQVRWPSRAATWKMVLAVFIYSALLITIIMLLDALFAWLFNLILN